MTPGPCDSRVPRAVGHVLRGCSWRCWSCWATASCDHVSLPRMGRAWCECPRDVAGSPCHTSCSMTPIKSLPRLCVSVSGDLRREREGDQRREAPRSALACSRNANRQRTRGTKMRPGPWWSWRRGPLCFNGLCASACSYHISRPKPLRGREVREC